MGLDDIQSMLRDDGRIGSDDGAVSCPLAHAVVLDTKTRGKMSSQRASPGMKKMTPPPIQGRPTRTGRR